ncbi:MAG: DUF3149 domain-containing protein [Chromatiales bacterium]|nr:DUF3149 domain-containing protein [Chromatiales bacterium]
MDLWMDLLFGNDIGLMSMIVLAVLLGIGFFFIWLFVAKSREPDA